eukprot:1235187-Pyramimonas_sp.AAC.3
MPLSPPSTSTSTSTLHFLLLLVLLLFLLAAIVIALLPSASPPLTRPAASFANWNLENSSSSSTRCWRVGSAESLATTLSTALIF